MDTDTRAYLDAKFDPIAEDIAEIKGDVKDMRRNIGALQRFRTQVVTIVSLAVLLFGGGTAWLSLLR